jgi:hypothetical protein
MKTYKIEIILELNEQSEPLEWLFEAIRELLEDGETIIKGRYIETEEIESV